MTTTGTGPRYVRAADRPPEDAIGTIGRMDIAELVGMWRNANPNTWGISAVELTDRGDRVWARAWANDPVAGQVNDWGEVPLDGLYADGPASNQVCAFRASFDLGHARTQIQGNMLHNVMVCAAFTTFTDGSGRADYLSREFLHRRG
jgi:hypothetical protein